MTRQLSTHSSTPELVEPRWRRRKDARSEEILEAALGCFAARGFAPTKMDDIARRAGIATGTLFRYFESKDALFRASIQHKLAAVIAQFEPTPLHPPLSASAAIEAFVARIAETMGSPAGVLPRLIMAEAPSFPDLTRVYMDKVIERCIGAVEGLIRAGVESGEFRPVEARTAAFCVCAPAISEALFRTGLESYAGLTLILPMPASKLTDIFLAGLRAGARSGGSQGDLDIFAER